MPDHFTYTPDFIENLLKRLAKAEGDIKKLERKQLTTAPYFSVANVVPSPTQGQIAVDSADDSLKYYSSGTWRTTGGSSDYVFLEEIVIASNGDTFDFTSITQAYRHLELRLWLGGTAGFENVIVCWNGPPFATDWHTRGVLSLDGAGPTEYTNDDAIGINITCGLNEGLPDSQFSSNFTLEFPYYSVPIGSTTFYETGQSVFFRGNGNSQGDGSPGYWYTDGMGLAYLDDPTATITSIQIKTQDDGFFAGSRASLYGIR